MAKKTIEKQGFSKPVSSKKKQILVVDDEEDTCKLVKVNLQDAGYKVIIALSGKEALSELKKQKVDLVLVDYFMPEMSGRKLCEEIRKDTKLKNIKLVFLTVAEYGEKGYEELKKLNILDYIKKPFVEEDLIKRVKKIIG